MQNNPKIESINSTINYILLSNQNLSLTSSHIFYLKIFYLIIIFTISLIFGLLPLCFNNCRKDLRLLNYANAFSAGIFLGIGFFHLMPDATENFENYFINEGKTSFINGWPMPYLLAFLSYSFILYLEKVAFNSHALVAHTHGDEEHFLNEDKENELKEPLLGSNNNINKSSKKIYHDCTYNLYDENNDNESYFQHNNNNINDNDEIGKDEQIIRNIISSKGQFSSVLHSRNLSKFIYYYNKIIYSVFAIKA